MERQFVITDIDYDTDGRKVKLPKELIIVLPEDIENTYEDIDNYISDEISNRTGYCHMGFACTPEIDEYLKQIKTK